MKQYLAFILLLFFTTEIFCQQNSITGIVVDNKNIPIPYATIFSQSKGKGVITNAEGRFSMPRYENDTIRIRCLGYNETSIPTAILIDNLNRIELKQAVYNLDEVTVTPIDAKAMVKKAIKMIPKNYPKGTTKINGIYKQITMTDGKYNGLFESDMNVYISDMVSKRKPKIEIKTLTHQLFKAKQNFFLIVPKSFLKLFGIYNYPFISKFNDNQYIYQNKISYGGKTLVKIGFKPQKLNPKRFQYAGSVYIDEATHAFVYIEYNLIRNDYGFYNFEGNLQRVNEVERKIMFSEGDKYYDVEYMIGVSSITRENGSRMIDKNSIFNFFSKTTDYNVKNYPVDSLSLYDTMFKSKGEKIDQSKGYSTDFILETTTEKMLKEKHP